MVKEVVSCVERHAQRSNLMCRIARSKTWFHASNIILKEVVSCVDDLQAAEDAMYEVGL
jgi:hypothetical protein